jgi:hypothetical protein
LYPSFADLFKSELLLEQICKGRIQVGSHLLTFFILFLEPMFEPTILMR